MCAVLSVPSSSGTGWASCSTAGTELCLARPLLLPLWCGADCWASLDGIEGKHWVWLSRRRSREQLSVQHFNTTRAAHNGSGAFPEVSETKGLSPGRAKAQGSLSADFSSRWMKFLCVWYNGLLWHLQKDLCWLSKHIRRFVTDTLTHPTAQYLHFLFHVHLQLCSRTHPSTSLRQGSEADVTVRIHKGLNYSRRPFRCPGDGT